MNQNDKFKLYVKTTTHLLVDRDGKAVTPMNVPVPTINDCPMAFKDSHLVHTADGDALVCVWHVIT